MQSLRFKKLGSASIHSQNINGIPQRLIAFIRLSNITPSFTTPPPYYSYVTIHHIYGHTLRPTTELGFNLFCRKRWCPLISFRFTQIRRKKRIIEASKCIKKSHVRKVNQVDYCATLISPLVWWWDNYFPFRLTPSPYYYVCKWAGVSFSSWFLVSCEKSLALHDG